MSDTRPGFPADEREYYERQIFDLRQLLEVSKSLSSTLDYNVLIESILYAVMGQFNVLRAGLFARKGLDAPWFSLHRNYKGFETEHGVDYAIPDEHPVIRLFQRQYGCYSLADIEARLGSLDGLAALVSLGPELVVPLKSKGAINGILVIGERIDSRGEFTAPEREYLVDIAVMAAIAINNAFLFEMTTTDMMTRLRMKHYFWTVLVERIDAIRGGGGGVSVLMLDIDRFKLFNDTHGHQFGDVVLKSVARTIQRMVRARDVAARFGGEEFCVMLPDADATTAFAIAERIRTAIAATVLEYEGTKVSVTISIGVAAFDPDRDINAKQLVERSDKALYASKEGGRNRSTVAV
ncbi:MAG TPA: diguanylate cyclase DgcA [Rectinemataceae bacterium]|nr:diguanylate cyclase DgcA [Rectinemataceae bacterium]